MGDEFKLIRPFGDNGAPGEHWIENILYPYRGNISAISDCYKFLDSAFTERLAIVIFGYEHDPARVRLETAVRSFEMIVQSVLRLRLGERIEPSIDDLIHPHHQVGRVYAWKLLR